MILIFAREIPRCFIKNFPVIVLNAAIWPMMAEHRRFRPTLREAESDNRYRQCAFNFFQYRHIVTTLTAAEAALCLYDGIAFAILTRGAPP